MIVTTDDNVAIENHHNDDFVAMDNGRQVNPDNVHPNYHQSRFNSHKSLKGITLLPNYVEATQ